jgi:hypothetical protein
MFKRIVTELRHHIPFTGLGAVTGIIGVVIIVAVGALPSVNNVSETVFYVLHPLHVVLSAGVTTALYRKYTRGRILPAILVGYFGSIGVATLSDSVVPFVGELLLDLPHAEAHIGFIEEWQIVNPAALLGIAIGLWTSHTRFPHAGHVLISTWASLFHTIMALGETVEWIQFLPIFVFLFLAVWLPCCLSDIVFPLLFTKGKIPVEEG